MDKSTMRKKSEYRRRYESRTAKKKVEESPMDYIIIQTVVCVFLIISVIIIKQVNVPSTVDLLTSINETISSSQLDEAKNFASNIFGNSGNFLSNLTDSSVNATDQPLTPLDTPTTTDAPTTTDIPTSTDTNASTTNATDANATEFKIDPDVLSGISTSAPDNTVLTDTTVKKQ